MLIGSDEVQHPSIFTSLPCKQITNKNIDFIKHSIELCTSSCHPLQQLKSFPTRLLDLGSVAESGCVRLIQTKDIPEADVPSLKYAALSYCWGNTIQPKTTPENLKKRTESISLKEMSAGQEDQARADWEQESEIMDMIYAQAYITICAASSPSCQVSFLQRETKPILRLGLRPASSDAFESSYLVTPCHTSMLAHGWFSADWDETIWHTRGWTFQERALSERLIVFGTHMIHFICSGFYSNETGYTDTCCANNRNAGGVTLPSSLSRPVSNEVRASVFGEFRGILRSVAEADFSRDRDRLPALAGIARRVHELTGSKYYAGCWEDNFHNDLPFFISCPPPLAAANPRDLDSELYFGPSWSFVSRNSGEPVRLAYHCGPFKPQYDWIQASTTPQGRTRFGEVSWGFLKVRTKVLLTSANLEMDEGRGGRFEAEVWLGGAEVFFDGQDLKAQCACVSNPHGDDMAWALISARLTGERRYLLGLLLRSTGRPREYYRIGLFKWGRFKDPGSNSPANWDTETIEII
ncbi:hypothetical protein M406DRAFT_72953 [Cryphonectria parasitica EP155]|uniref:Heterokaryon incompatibility domain-containing protein n=1 Tax=Cryphonectria parasitica (strain ATCC 38755 / EP155) TaxID=660469 RepID=A0A9P5CK07_CRYP1|nr:uncharacterized protein M406DRAFT_72953 [Cryphonectria parasitica EP155]KAF3760461.1 hypothetical protein M406DRAFT_72953 [Cryphonectria parasitica EP155]